jgi:hypothetical protein
MLSWMQVRIELEFQSGADSPAQATGRLTLITNAMAREIVVGKHGKAEAVTYIDRTTRTEKQVHARCFVLAASTCESHVCCSIPALIFSPTVWPILPGL